MEISGFKGKMGLGVETSGIQNTHLVVCDTLLLVLLEVVVELHCRSLGAEIRIWELVCESCWSSHILWVNLYQGALLVLIT